MTPVMLSSKKRTTVFSICEGHFLSSIHPSQCPQKERAEAKAKLIRKWYSSNVKEEFAVLTRLFSCHEPSSHSSCHDIPSLTPCGHITRSGNILHRLQQVPGRGSLTDAAARRPAGPLGIGRFREIGAVQGIRIGSRPWSVFQEVSNRAARAASSYLLEKAHKGNSISLPKYNFSNFDIFTCGRRSMNWNSSV